VSNVELPRWAKPLWEHHRYKSLRGGRGGGKSWVAAQALLLQAADKPLRVLCARELQISIQDSVHKLLSERIEAMGLSRFYEVQQSLIRGKNGSEFLFSGVRSNVTKIKSMEGVDRVWLEEAQACSEASWSVLIPTVRKEGSEISLRTKTPWLRRTRRRGSY
jgi:phage terminase large subunit